MSVAGMRRPLGAARWELPVLHAHHIGRLSLGPKFSTGLMGVQAKQDGDSWSMEAVGPGFGVADDPNCPGLPELGALISMAAQQKQDEEDVGNLALYHTGWDLRD